MAPPPKFVEAVEISNTTGKDLSVSAVYKNHKDGSDIVETASVAAGGKHTFAAKQVDMGSYKAVAPITSVKVTDAGHEHVLEPQVGSIVKLLGVNLAEVAGKPTLTQK